MKKPIVLFWRGSRTGDIIIEAHYSSYHVVIKHQGVFAPHDRAYFTMQVWRYQLMVHEQTSYDVHCLMDSADAWMNEAYAPLGRQGKWK